jgi:hypothetical protein
VARQRRDLGLEGADVLSGAAAADDRVAAARELERQRAAQPPADPSDKHRPRPRRRPRCRPRAAGALGRRHLPGYSGPPARLRRPHDAGARVFLHLIGPWADSSFTLAWYREGLRIFFSILTLLLIIFYK